MSNPPSSSTPAGPVSIIIPVWNGGQGFGLCVSAALAAVRPPHEIIVVADGEGDGAWRQAETAGISVLKMSVNGGPARARNAGAKAALSPILFFVDADVVIPPDALDIILRVFSDDPGLAALIGSYDDEPAEKNFLSQYKNLFHHYVHQHAAPEASTFWGACGAIRREAFETAGGFNESYRLPSIEDIELGYRLTEAGYRIQMVPTLQVKHLKRWESWSLIRTDFFQRAMPWTELLLGRKSVGRDLNLGITYKASIAISYLLCLAMALAIYQRQALLAGVILLICFVAINWSLLYFFYRKRGLLFTLGCVCWKFVYDLYSGAGFICGALRFSLRSN